MDQLLQAARLGSIGVALLALRRALAAGGVGSCRRVLADCVPGWGAGRARSATHLLVVECCRASATGVVLMIIGVGVAETGSED